MLKFVNEKCSSLCLIKIVFICKNDHKQIFSAFFVFIFFPLQFEEIASHVLGLPMYLLLKNYNFKYFAKNIIKFLFSFVLASF